MNKILWKKKKKNCFPIKFGDMSLKFNLLNYKQNGPNELSLESSCDEFLFGELDLLKSPSNKMNLLKKSYLLLLFIRPCFSPFFPKHQAHST